MNGNRRITTALLWALVLLWVSSSSVVAEESYFLPHIRQASKQDRFHSLESRRWREHLSDGTRRKRSDRSDWRHFCWVWRADLVTRRIKNRL